MKLFHFQANQKNYNLASLGFFAIMVAAMVVIAVVNNFNPEVHSFIGSSEQHFRLYSVLLGVVMAAALFVSYLKGNALALKLSTLIAVITISSGLKLNAFETAVPQAIWIPFILALALTNLRWSLFVFALTVAVVCYRFPNAFQAPFGIHVTAIILMLLTVSRLVQNLLLRNATAAEQKAHDMAADITRKNQQLKESQDALDATLAAIPDTLFEMDECGTYLAIRTNDESLLPAARDDLLGRTVNDVLPPESATVVHQALAEAKQHGRSYGRVIRQSMAPGDVWFELSVTRKDTAASSQHRFIVISRDITSRHRAEEEVRRLSQVIEQSPEAIIITDRDAHIVYVNPAFTKSSGYATEDAIGRAAAFLGSGKTPPATKAAMWAALVQGQAWEGEFINRRKDGSDYLEEVIISPLRDTSGDVTHYVAIKRDITDQKQQEQEIARDRNRVANVLSATEAGPWEWDLVSDRLILDNASTNMIGYTLDQFGDDHLQAWLSRIHPEDRIIQEASQAKHLAGDSERYETEYRIQHADGHWVWIQARGKVIDWGEDRLPRTMYGVHLDITAHKQADEQHRYLEGVLHSAIEAIGEGFSVYDATDRLTWCNEQYRRLYPLSAPSIIPGTTFEDIIRYGIAHGQYPEAQADPERWLQKRLAAHQQCESDFTQKLPNGRWLEIRERKTANGSTVGFRIDITELMQAKQVAEAANRAKSEFLATMSHEIRTPMNSILGMAQMLCGPEVSDPRCRDYGCVILDSGRMLLSILNNVLDLAKVEAGRVELDLKPWQPQQLADDILALFRSTAHSKGLGITATWQGPARQHYLADGYRLQQMLSNLVSNAIKFTASGSIDIRLSEVERHDQLAMLEFAVSDTGIGIPHDKQNALFQPFTQADSSTSRRFGGSGLGLSIVRNLAKLMGGEAGLESEEGKGSRLWFRIPATPAPMISAAGEANEARQTRPGLLPGFSGSVLVADDNALERKVLGTLLSQLGLSVSFARDGHEAVTAACADKRPDMILMDCVMPGLDGYAASREIRDHEQLSGLPRIPIVAISASVFAEDRERCRQSDMDHFLPKPFAVSELRQLLVNLLTPDAATTETTGTPTAQARIFDRAQLRQAIDLLAPLLEMGKFDALQRFAELQANAVDTDIAGEIDDIADAVKTFQFQIALGRLRALIND